MTAIAKNGLTSLEEVCVATKTAASCGQCTFRVEALNTSILGEDDHASKRKPMCKCTDLTYAEVHGLIVSRRLDYMPAIMQELCRKTSCGSPPCRPALNYAPLCVFRLDCYGDAQSRFVNQRVHANVQRDGAFSPPCLANGGLTTPWVSPRATLTRRSCPR